MELDMSSVRFENRIEIENIIVALKTWQNEHNGEKPTETVLNLIEILDTLSMSW